MSRNLAFSCISALLLLAASTSVAETLIRLESPGLDRLQVRGFELPRDAKVDVEAVGLRPSWAHDFTAYSWILETTSRKLVWEMQSRDASRVDRSDVLRRVQKQIDLPKGRYELYIYSGTNDDDRDFHIGNVTIMNGFRHVVHMGHFWSDDNEDLRDELRDCYVQLASTQVAKGDVHEFEVTGDLPGALVRHNRLGDQQYGQDAFRLDKPMSLRIYSLLELPRDYREFADGAWIIDTATRKRVWEPDHHNTDDAGGARKNRLFDAEVKLDRGNYVLCYGTDDSHSWDAFNARPPYDAPNWGVTVLPGKDFDAAAFHLGEAPARPKPLVELTRLRDDEFLEQPFRLARETTLWVYAVGEYDDGSNDFADHGWIRKSGNDDIVWEMTENNTVGAGGAEKNRMFDGLVTLPAGDYVATAVTDDSHSYHHWNSATPFDREAWGLAIYPAPGSDASGFQKLEKAAEGKESGDALVSMVRVRDDERRHERFTLKERTRVHIHALGEGERDEMADYGWITDEKSGDVVWEMTWRNTRPAGGARKNRLFDGDVLLEPGPYEVHYESDGSHSFRSWNAAMPRDPASWGITVTKAQR